MEFEELGISGAWIAHSSVYNDDRGFFREWYKVSDAREKLGINFDVEQANISTSKIGAVRGIHYSLIPRGQGKWVTCVTGSIWDVVVDIRPSSPTFKKWIGIKLDGSSGNSLIVSAGLGHGFVALQDNSSVAYLLTSPYSPVNEFGIHPLDSELAISWPISDLLISTKDSLAPSFSDRRV